MPPGTSPSSSRNGSPPTTERSESAGVRIVPCFLPKKSPWLNAVEPKWVHGKRKVVEPDLVLAAYELADRVCEVFGCINEPHLSIPQEVA